MPYNPATHNRHSIRLPGYDYSAPGAYFLTILTHKKEHLFGKVMNGEVQLSLLGEIVKEQWEKIPVHISNVHLDAFVVMPNHIHGILVITARTAHMGKDIACEVWFDQQNFTTHCSNALPAKLGSQSGSVPAIVQNFKSITSRKINKLRLTPRSTIWHRNYYEHIIRDEEDFNRIQQYILENPSRWDG